MGWLLVRKHADIKRKGACLDMSDLESDQLVMFQKKSVQSNGRSVAVLESRKKKKTNRKHLFSNALRYYGILMPSFCFIIPTLMPYFILNESLSSSWFVASALRYVLTLHATWLVNSVAHIWGWKRKYQHKRTHFLQNQNVTNPIAILSAFYSIR